MTKPGYHQESVHRVGNVRGARSAGIGVKRSRATNEVGAQAAYPHLGILRHTRTFLGLLWYCFSPAHRDIALLRGPMKQADPKPSRWFSIKSLQNLKARSSCARAAHRLLQGRERLRA